jgi:hypothetical protein
MLQHLPLSSRLLTMSAQHANVQSPAQQNAQLADAAVFKTLARLLQ